MAGVSAQGGTFTFGSFAGAITGISVQTPEAEVVDMTDVAAAAGQTVLVPTGDWSGGSVSVDYIKTSSGPDPQTLVKQVGQLTFASAGFSISRRAILQSASMEARVGAAVTGTLNFVVTDYTGS
jgi:hypothetical protein